MAVKRTWPRRSPPPKYQPLLSPTHPSPPRTRREAPPDTLVVSREVWSGLAPVTRAQVQQAFSRVVQEVMRDSARR